VEFRFKQSSCVVVGTFNIYIIQPKLLGEMGVFPHGEVVTVMGDVSQPGTRMVAQGTTWTIRPDRLVVETDKSTVDCGEFIARTLEALCWTPVMAVGINAVFTADASVEEQLPDAVRLPKCEAAIQRTSHIGIAHDDSTLNIQISATEKCLELSLNLHRDLSALRQSKTQVDISREAQNVCNLFVARRAAAIEAAHNLLGGEFII
jgi:hypothetical protein